VKQRLLERGLHLGNIWYGTDFGVGSPEVTERICLYNDRIWVYGDNLCIRICLGFIRIWFGFLKIAFIRSL
jgi:hypothetical protein